MESEDKVVKQAGRIEKGKGAPSYKFVDWCSKILFNMGYFMFPFQNHSVIKNAYRYMALNSTVAWQIDLFRLRYA